MEKFLSLEEFAARRGIAFGTLRDYYAEDKKTGHWHRLPKPDAVIGETSHRPRHGWLPETVDNWVRPGQGARTDLKS